MAKPVLAAMPVSTGGILFNRKQPRGDDGAEVPILNRKLEAQDGKTWLFNEGRDFTSMADDARGKKRIPLTSVVNRVGDCGVCGLTAAQVSCPSISSAHNTKHVCAREFNAWSYFRRSSGC